MTAYKDINEREKKLLCFVLYTVAGLDLRRHFVCKLLAEESAEWVHRNDTFAKHMCTVNPK